MRIIFVFAVFAAPVYTYTNTYLYLQMRSLLQCGAVSNLEDNAVTHSFVSFSPLKCPPKNIPTAKGELAITDEIQTEI